MPGPVGKTGRSLKVLTGESLAGFQRLGLPEQVREIRRGAVEPRSVPEWKQKISLVGDRPNEKVEQVLVAALRGDESEVVELVPEFKGEPYKGFYEVVAYHKYARQTHGIRTVQTLAEDPAVSNELSGEILLAGLLHDYNRYSVFYPQANLITIYPNGIKDFLGERFGISEESRSCNMVSTLWQLHHNAVVFLMEVNEDLKRGTMGEGSNYRHKISRCHYLWIMERILERNDLDLYIYLALARADILSCQMGKLYKELGVRDGDDVAMKAKVDTLIAEIKKLFERFEREKEKELL